MENCCAFDQSISVGEGCEGVRCGVWIGQIACPERLLGWPKGLELRKQLHQVQAAFTVKIDTCRQRISVDRRAVR